MFSWEPVSFSWPQLKSKVLQFCDFSSRTVVHFAIHTPQTRKKGTFVWMAVCPPIHCTMSPLLWCWDRNKTLLKTGWMLSWTCHGATPVSISCKEKCIRNMAKHLFQMYGVSINAYTWFYTLYQCVLLHRPPCSAHIQLLPPIFMFYVWIKKTLIVRRVWWNKLTETEWRSSS